MTPKAETSPTPTRKTRSRMGCYTCRSRKKKCDERSYPTCQNCQAKGLRCEWPAEKHELKKSLQQVVYVGSSSKKRRTSSTSTSLDSPPSISAVSSNSILTDATDVFNSDTDFEEKSFSDSHKNYLHNELALPSVVKHQPSVVANAPSSRKSYFLEKIALQQDIIDETEKPETPQITPPPIVQQQVSPEQLPQVLSHQQSRQLRHIQQMEDIEIFDFLDPDPLQQLE